MRAEEPREKVAELFVNVERGAMPPSTYARTGRSEVDAIPRLIVNGGEMIQNKVSFSGAIGVLIQVLNFADDIRDGFLISVAAGCDTAVLGFNYGSRRYLMNEPGMARADWIQHLTKIDKLTDGASTRGIMRLTRYFNSVTSGSLNINESRGALGWFRRTFPKVANKGRILAASIGHRFKKQIDALETSAHAVSVAEHKKVNEAHLQQIKQDAERTFNEALHPTRRTKTTSSTKVAGDTEKALEEYEKMCVIVETVNSQFVKKIVDGEFEENGIRMDDAECELNFSEKKNDIAMLLASDQHFLDHTFDDIDPNPIYEIVSSDILRKAGIGAFTVGSRYMEELLIHIKDEFA